VNANKDDVVEGRKLGVELICRVLQVAPSTYYAARGRVPSARVLNDVVLSPQLCDLWENNFQVYGVRKLWKAARRAGIDIGRDQTARLMKTLGMRGVLRSKRVKTTRPDPTAVRHPDLVKRHFSASAPNQLWVTDLTFVATWAGVAYVCFIIDVFSRMIVGWRVASHMRTETVLDAIEMARWSRGQTLPGLRCHSDAGAQGGFNRSSQHFEIMEVCDGSSSTGCGSGGQTEVEVARSPEVSTAGRGCVLGRDREGAAAH
jgi:transposase InsO family protein